MRTINGEDWRQHVVTVNTIFFSNFNVYSYIK